MRSILKHAGAACCHANWLKYHRLAFLYVRASVLLEVPSLPPRQQSTVVMALPRKANILANTSSTLPVACSFAAVHATSVGYIFGCSAVFLGLATTWSKQNIVFSCSSPLTILSTLVCLRCRPLSFSGHRLRQLLLQLRPVVPPEANAVRPQSHECLPLFDHRQRSSLPG